MKMQKNLNLHFSNLCYCYAEIANIGNHCFLFLFHSPCHLLMTRFPSSWLNHNQHKSHTLAMIPRGRSCSGSVQSKWFVLVWFTTVYKYTKKEHWITYLRSKMAKNCIPQHVRCTCTSIYLQTSIRSKFEWRKIGVSQEYYL